jgi:hypothetical protein
MSGNNDAVLKFLSRAMFGSQSLKGRHSGDHVVPFMEDYLVLILPASHEWAGNEASLDVERCAVLMWNLA